MTDDNIETKFNATTTYKTVSTIIKEATDENLMDIRPPYQREEVWTDFKKSHFINSVIRGIVPNCIIFNKNDETDKLTCIDGKQRISSLVKFRNNDIPVMIDEKMVFYDKINSDNEKSLMRSLTTTEKGKFNCRNIPIVEYFNLSYEDQIDIFNRIQNGMALSKGELVSSKFLAEELSIKFTKFCDENYTLISKFVNKNRKEHVRYITHIFYILNSSDDKISSITKCEDNFIKKIKSLKLLENYLNKTKRTLEILFSDKILGHVGIKKENLNQNLLLTFIIFFRDKYQKKLDKINDDDLAKLRFTIRETIQECQNKKIGSNKNNQIILNIYNIMSKNYNYLDKNKKSLQEEIATVINDLEEENDLSDANQNSEDEVGDEVEEISDEENDDKEKIVIHVKQNIKNNKKIKA